MEENKQDMELPRHIEAAVAEAHKRDFHGALAILDRAILNGEGSAETYWLRGIVHEALREYEKAFEDLAVCSSLAGNRKRYVQKHVCRVIRKVVKKGVNNTWASVIASYSLYMEGKIEEALLETQKSTHWLAEYFAGIYCAILERPKEAKKHLNNVIKHSDIADTEIRRRAMHILFKEVQIIGGNEEARKKGTGTTNVCRGS